MNAFAERLQRVDGEDRAGRRRGRGVRIGTKGADLFGDRLDAHDFVDVGRTQLEDALEPAIGRNRFDAQRHPLEQRSARFRSHVFQPQAPALPGVGIDHDDQRLGVLGDVAAALVEELVGQRHVRRIDVVHVTEVRRVRQAVGRAGEELRRQQALEAGGERLERDAHGRGTSSAPACGPGVCSKMAVARIRIDHRRPGDPAAGADPRDADPLETGQEPVPLLLDQARARRRQPGGCRRRCP